MIACPLCGGDTKVVETRKTKSGARRRRRCDHVGCPGKVTTLEVVMGASDRRAGALILVPRDTLVTMAQTMSKLIAECLSGQSPEENPCQSPED